MDEQKSRAETLYHFAGALKLGVDGRFLAQEHATALMKNELRKFGYELPRREKQLEETN